MPRLKTIKTELLITLFFDVFLFIFIVLWVSFHSYKSGHIPLRFVAIRASKKSQDTKTTEKEIISFRERTAYTLPYKTMAI